MEKILLIGASGFMGGHLAHALLQEGYAVRCLARTPAKLSALAQAGCEILAGDITDAAAVRRAVEGVRAVYISIHTLSPQPGGGGQRFMAIEQIGVRNVLAACQAEGVQQVVYVTSLGTAADASSEWLRERWHTEQLLVSSGLAATVIRPGFVIGAGAGGFTMLASQARRPIAFTLGGNRYPMRAIALDDLLYYLVGVLDEPRAANQVYDVGNDETVTNNQLLDAVAGILGRRPPFKVRIPRRLLRVVAPLLERLAKLPAGAFQGFLDSQGSDGIGNPTPIRALLPRPLLTLQQAIKRALEVAP
ncbi:MAG: SDR family oxidoreductase [Janthinobacterium lividum]